MNNNLDNPYYYLENFRFVLNWVLQRYRDLLVQDEIDFIDAFATAPIPAQGLLVRMVMRKGDLFRTSKLVYDEIGDPVAAAHFLIERQWVQADPCISLEQLFAILTKNEFAQVLALPIRSTTSKTELFEAARATPPEPRRYSAWHFEATDDLYEVRIGSLCDRIRLMFFGNAYQDWSEFVLADLGIYAYEKVTFSEASRAFHHRCDIDIYLQLHECRKRLGNEDALSDIERNIHAIDMTDIGNS